MTATLLSVPALIITKIWSLCKKNPAGSLVRIKNKFAASHFGLPIYIEACFLVSVSDM